VKKNIGALVLVVLTFCSSCDLLLDPNSCDETPQNITLEPLGYNNYVNGGNVGYCYNVTNNTESVIKSIIFQGTLYTTVNGSHTYTYTYYNSISPVQIERDVWIILGCMSDFYKNHTLDKVIITYDGGEQEEIDWE